jgi:hypothetical protein
MARGEQGGEPDGRSSRLKGSGMPMAGEAVLIRTAPHVRT